MKVLLAIILYISFCLSYYGQKDTINTKDEMNFLYLKGSTKVNHCTPWHHMRCIAITGTEVYEDGRDGKKGRHWWRMSYIGRACTEKHGKVLGTILEGFWAVPHYAGVVIGSSFGWLIYAVRGPRDAHKVAKRQYNRNLKKAKKKRVKHDVTLQ